MLQARRGRRDGRGTVGAGELAGTVAVTTAERGCGRGICRSVFARNADRRRILPGKTPLSTVDGGAVPVVPSVRRRVRVKTRSIGSDAVGGTGSRGSERAYAAITVIAAEFSRDILVGEVACWRTAVLAAGASAEPVRSSKGSAKDMR